MKCMCPICAECPAHPPPSRYRPATLAEEPTPLCERCRRANALADDLAGIGALPEDL